MKNISIVTIFLLSTIIFSQNDIGNNELKLNLVYSMAGFPELTYERLVSEDVGIGISGGLPLSNKILDAIGYEYEVTAFGRFYFGNKKGAGYFIEANAAFYTEQIHSVFRPNKVGSDNGFGMGLATGSKFLTINGWVGEVYAGLGRNFVNQNFLDLFYPRFGLTVGKRF